MSMTPQNNGDFQLDFARRFVEASDMLKLRYDDKGQVRGLPDAIRPGDSLSVELIADHLEISSSDTLSLSLALEKPVPIASGDWSITWGASTVELPAAGIDAHLLGLALNRLSAIVSAGGVDVTGKDGLFTVTFRSNGARADFTIAHSAFGTMTNRALTLIAGGASNVETVEIDLTLQTLVAVTSASNISEAAVTVANVATGSVSVAQNDRITISRMPDAGKFQIRTAADTGTMWLSADVSTYQIETALEDIEPGEFLVARDATGETIKIEIKRTAVGVNPAITVSETFIGPIGVTMTLDTSKVLRLLDAASVALPASAVLTFSRGTETQFSQLVTLAPVLLSHGQPV
jgi:hypothetical protein